MTRRGHDLVLRGVTFAYGPHSEPVLRELDLTVPAGDHLAIVGPSGIGKSTLAGLLCGLLRPDSGTVEIDGAIAAELPTGRLARLRTLIPQQAYVFTGTVWDNLTYLCAAATPRQVDNAVAALGAESLLCRLGGVSAELSPEDLSAGQRQLVALVRAYLSPAPVVVLDEATCHLDPVAERTVEQAFARRGGTLIVIAHRVSSALRARRVLVLDGTGAVVGDHWTLLSASPLYRELLGHWRAGTDTSPGWELQPVGVRRERDRAAQPDERLEEFALSSHGQAGGPGNRRHPGKGGQMDHDAEPAGEPVPAEVPAQEPGTRRPAWWRRRTGRGTPEPAPADNGRAAGTGSEPTPPAGATDTGEAGGDHRQLIFGQVTEDGETPVAGATLTLTDLPGQQLDRDTSDAEGHYRLTPPAGGSYLVVCAAASHQPTAALVVVADGAQRHDMALPAAGARLAGTVSAAGSGQPIPDAAVTLVDIHGDVVAATGTGPEGCFGFPGQPPGRYTLTVAAPSLQPVARNVELPAQGDVRHDVAVAIRGRLQGSVRTAGAGTPVAEALATLIAPDGRVLGSVATDADGRFSFDDLDPGPYTVIATGYPPSATEVRVDTAAPTETVIALRPPTVADAGIVDGDRDGYAPD